MLIFPLQRFLFCDFITMNFVYLFLKKLKVPINFFWLVKKKFHIFTHDQKEEPNVIQLHVY
jgi:hypothetical protein